MNFMLAHEFDPTRTIADVYEMPMNFQSGFCKIYFKKVSNYHACKKSIVGLQTTEQNERYVSGIFANAEKNSED